MKRNTTFLRSQLVVLTLLIFAFATMSWAQSTNSDQSTTSTPTTSEKTSASDTKMTSSEKEETDIAKRLDNAANVLGEIMGTPDKAIPGNVLADAKCVLVVPSMIHIAVGFGGRHGKGVATCRTTNGWSAPAPVDLTGGS